MNNKAWWFCPEDRLLPHGDGRKVEIGEAYTVDGPLKLCGNGLHWSRRIVDALWYRESTILHRVEISGEILEEGDKGCSSMRTHIAEYDLTEILPDWGRWCALQVVDLIEASADDVALIRQYLESGDESIRAAARDAWDAASAAASAAASDAAWAAASDAARDAACAAASAAARDAARDAASAAEWAAARDARAAARDAARDAASAAEWAAARDASDAASDAARDAQESHLIEMIEAKYGEIQ